MTTLHTLTLTDSEYSLIRELLRQNLQTVNEVRTSLKTYEKVAYSKCDKLDASPSSQVNFKYLNSIRNSSRILLKKQRKLESLQRKFKYGNI